MYTETKKERCRDLSETEILASNTTGRRRERPKGDSTKKKNLSDDFTESENWKGENS